MEKEAKDVEKVKEKGELIQGIVLGKSVAYLNVLGVVDKMILEENNGSDR